MLFKMTRHGQGGAKKAAIYLTQEKDANGKIRPEVKVLRGDPFHVAAVADGLDFKHKYRSGVIAFAPEDQPTEAEINEVIDSFADVAFAGLDPERRAFSAILHSEENGGCHIHVFIARTDLITGKSFNPMPPGWQKTFGPWRDALNFEKGWSRPDDPARARLTQPNFTAYKNKKSAKKEITDFLEDLVMADKIQNRDDVISTLKKLKIEVTRQGDDYIRVKPDSKRQGVSLDGKLYERNFNGDEYRRSTSIDARRDYKRGGVVDEGRAKSARDDLNRRVEKRTEYNRHHYPPRPEAVVDTHREGVRKLDNNGAEAEPAVCETRVTDTESHRKQSQIDSKPGGQDQQGRVIPIQANNEAGERGSRDGAQKSVISVAPSLPHWSESMPRFMVDSVDRNAGHNDRDRKKLQRADRAEAEYRDAKDKERRDQDAPDRRKKLRISADELDAGKGWGNEIFWQACLSISSRIGAVNERI